MAFDSYGNIFVVDSSNNRDAEVSTILQLLQ